MKRTLIIVAGFATLAAGVYLASRVGAQTYQPAQGTQPTAAPLRSRIAVINMVQVLKNYKKFQNAEAEVKAQVQKVDSQLEVKNGEALKMKKSFQEATDPNVRDGLEKDLKKLQREMQELQEDTRKNVMKLQGELSVQIYKEVEDAVKLFAKVNDIELVLHFNDAMTQVDYYSPANVQRKLLTVGPLMPMYFDPRMDISMAVTKMLNDRLAAAGASRAPAGN